MKYKNATNILPQDLITKIQEYVQGEYLYIPIKERMEPRNLTEYEKELQKRDAHIYTRRLEGMSNKRLAQVYALSESSIRRIIIAQRKRFDGMKEQIGRAIHNWQMEDCEIVQIYDSAWQIGEHYILKVYDSADMLERNIKMLSILDDKNVPVGKLIPTKENTLFVKDENKYYILTEKLAGNNIVDIHNIADIGIKMGNVIAKLHCAFQECEKQEEFWNSSLLEEMKGWIRETFSKHNWQYIKAEAFDDVVSQLESLYAKLAVQLIHRDVHFGNFLFSGGEFSGYIDFDLSQRNIRIFDLCYFCLGLLSEEEKMGMTSQEWFGMTKDVFKGYHRYCPLSEEEIKAVTYVMKSIELLFAAWFMDQGDIKCTENAMDIYNFVDENSEKIEGLILRIL